MMTSLEEIKRICDESLKESQFRRYWHRDGWEDYLMRGVIIALYFTAVFVTAWLAAALLNLLADWI